MLSWSINLFRIRGIQLSLHFSFFLLLGYAAWEGFWDEGLNGLLWSSILLISFFTCVVLHELGHSLMAKYFGIQVRRILLMPIGGMAEFETIPKEPYKELWITVAGPAVNAVIACFLIPFFWGSGSLVSLDNTNSFAGLMRSLLAANIIMGLFNLIPVFPMDGGRILRALLAFKLPYVRATFFAASLGKVLALIAVCSVVFFPGYIPFLSPNPVMTVILFSFIFFAGESEYRYILRREKEERYIKTLIEQNRAIIDTLATSTEEPPFL
ncbi:MAG: site-2 protease family protein [Verrucomicrobiota bacterium]